MHSTDPAPGTVYLIHLDVPYKHARHYTGWTLDLDARLQAHRDGRGARLMEVITAAAITWQLPVPGRADATASARSRTGTRPPGCARSAPPSHTRSPPAGRPSSPRPGNRSRCCRHRCRSARANAGCAWPSSSLPSVPDGLPAGSPRPSSTSPGPYHQAGSHTAAQDEAHRVFTQTVTSRIALLAAADGAYALGGHQ